MPDTRQWDRECPQIILDDKTLCQNFVDFTFLRSDAGTSAAGHGCGISDVCIPDTVSYPCFFTTAYDLCFLINGSNYLHCGSESDRKDPGY
jgi:hypothetical protein